LLGGFNKLIRLARLVFLLFVVLVSDCLMASSVNLIGGIFRNGKGGKCVLSIGSIAPDEMHNMGLIKVEGDGESIITPTVSNFSGGIIDISPLQIPPSLSVAPPSVDQSVGLEVGGINLFAASILNYAFFGNSFPFINFVPPSASDGNLVLPSQGQGQGQGKAVIDINLRDFMLQGVTKCKLIDSIQKVVTQSNQPVTNQTIGDYFDLRLHYGDGSPAPSSYSAYLTLEENIEKSKSKKTTSTKVLVPNVLGLNVATSSSDGVGIANTLYLNLCQGIVNIDINLNVEVDGKTCECPCSDSESAPGSAGVVVDAKADITIDKCADSSPVSPPVTFAPGDLPLNVSDIDLEKLQEMLRNITAQSGAVDVGTVAHVTSSPAAVNVATSASVMSGAAMLPSLNLGLSAASSTIADALSSKKPGQLKKILDSILLAKGQYQGLSACNIGSIDAPLLTILPQTPAVSVSFPSSSLSSSMSASASSSQEARIETALGLSGSPDVSLVRLARAFEGNLTTDLGEILKAYVKDGCVPLIVYHVDSQGSYQLVFFLSYEFNQAIGDFIFTGLIKTNTGSPEIVQLTRQQLLSLNTDCWVVVRSPQQK